ncbi:MAG: sugar phosphate nucleotidyltransferase, partial [Candidatus Dormibacterales bacterium]
SRAFATAVRRAVAAARSGERLVTIGLKPRYPATGYGYVRAGEELRLGRSSVRRVVEFVEKPDAKRAAAYARSGSYFWNLSMFCWRAERFVAELGLQAPRHLRGLRRVMRARARGEEGEAARIYRGLAVEAVDYAVMERTRDLVLVPASFGWNDVGSWAELHDILGQDREGNVLDGEAALIDTRDCFLSVPGKLVAAIGLREMVVVDTPDALLICPKSRAQDVKRVVGALERAGKIRYL